MLGLLSGIQLLGTLFFLHKYVQIGRLKLKSLRLPDLYSSVYAHWNEKHLANEEVLIIILYTFI